MTALLALGLVAAAVHALALSERRLRRPPPPPLLLPAVLLPCGCLRLEIGLLACPAHDPAAEPPVEQWAAEMEDQ